VQHAKPAPDLFLLAAERMQVDPERCLVIEDSKMGLQAATAANMCAWQFRGGSHMRDAKSEPEYQSVSDMRQLLDMFVAAGLCVQPEGQS
jgi:beta-phosphoglucomutase-like phosphatase (HAD superfamily)